MNVRHFFSNEPTQPKVRKDKIHKIILNGSGSYLPIARHSHHNIDHICGYFNGNTTTIPDIICECAVSEAVKFFTNFYLISIYIFGFLSASVIHSAM